MYKKDMTLISVHAPIGSSCTDGGGGGGGGGAHGNASLLYDYVSETMAFYDNYLEKVL